MTFSKYILMNVIVLTTLRGWGHSKGVRDFYEIAALLRPKLLPKLALAEIKRLWHKEI